jgi:hypothetical protein
LKFNPYASPAAPAADPGMISQFITSRRLVAILARWTLICTVSAAPSFFWGCVLHHQFQHIMGMMAGIIVFILGYTLVECSVAYRRVIHWPHVRTMVWIGYGTRLTISIIFPIAIVVDAWTGMLSIAIVQPGSFEGAGESGFLIVLLTTIVQGTFLNVVLFGYMGLVWCVVWLVAKLRGRTGDSPQHCKE